VRGNVIGVSTVSTTTSRANGIEHCESVRCEAKMPTVECRRASWHGYALSVNSLCVPRIELCLVNAAECGSGCLVDRKIRA
jgi:hypothetical protein